MLTFTRITNNQSLSPVLSILIILSFLIPASFPAHPVSAALQPALRLAASTLTATHISTAQANQFFDQDGLILVNDLESNLSLIGTSGEGFLQTRIFPRGEAGTPGAGYYGYLYRLDLSGLRSTIDSLQCVSQVAIPFENISEADFDGDGKPEDYFIISQDGATGSVVPSAVLFDDVGKIILQFSGDPVCSGNPTSDGESSYFIGLISTEPYQTVSVDYWHSSGQGTLSARAPFNRGAATCQEIQAPAEVPNPSVIHFDSFASLDPVENTYRPGYGVTFNEGVKAGPAVDFGLSFAASSSPNVAVQPYNPGLEQSLVIGFDNPTSHAGFFVGNQSAEPAFASLIGYSSSGTVICQTDLSLPAQEMNNFLGFYDPAARLARLELEYQRSTASEVIDDLYFVTSPNSQPIEFPRPLRPLSEDGPRIRLNTSDNLRLSATFDLSDPSFWMDQDDVGKPYLRFGLPGSELDTNLPGYPDIPYIRRIIAVPEGATPVVDQYSILVRSEFLADLFPSQPSAVDIDYEDPPFVIDPAIYSSPDQYPEKPVTVIPLGKQRDLNLALLVVAGGQYIPASKKLVVFKSVELNISFQGGSGTFLPDFSNNPFEAPSQRQYSGVLNVGAIGSYLRERLVPTCTGSELLIFSRDHTWDAAIRLANWKIQKGIATQVVEVSASGISSAEEIRAYIKERYDNCNVRPAYVILMGDAEFIEPFAFGMVFSDLGFALMSEGDEIPDLAVGRIPADTLDEADAVVTKIINYERNPPTQDHFYQNVTLASFFQCCDAVNPYNLWVRDERSFVETSERVRSTLTTSGKQVDRIYTTDVDRPLFQPGYYKNGALLPSALNPTSGFAWDGSGGDILRAMNIGTGLVMHRGHGYEFGWADPSLDVSELSYLTNGNMTPVIYSINCSSAIWDGELSGLIGYDDLSFGEAVLLMSNGGAVSLIGDTRVSPSWANSALARGLFDATWPTTDMSIGTFNSIRRLGDILNYAKLYMLVATIVPQTAGSVSLDNYKFNNRIYHVLGDPTLELWTSKPERKLTSLASLKWITGGGQTVGLEVDYPVDGAIITILQNGLPVGRGEVSGGQVNIELIEELNENLQMIISASLENEVSVMIGQPIFLPVIQR